jgi:prepilin-type N-terminal cleavage/methylation domain-containing protein
MRSHGFTLPEMLITLTVVGTLSALGVSGFASLREAAALRSSTRVIRQQLTLARRAAVNGRHTVRFRSTDGQLVLETPTGTILAATSLKGVDPLPVDSVVLRPASFRFNARGQAAPGSVYLFRGNRSVRIVCNFLGRLRTEPVRRIG